MSCSSNQRLIFNFFTSFTLCLKHFLRSFFPHCRSPFPLRFPCTCSRLFKHTQENPEQENITRGRITYKKKKNILHPVYYPFEGILWQQLCLCLLYITALRFTWQLHLFPILHPGSSCVRRNYEYISSRRLLAITFGSVWDWSATYAFINKTGYYWGCR